MSNLGRIVSGSTFLEEVDPEVGRRRSECILNHPGSSLVRVYGSDIIRGKEKVEE